MLPLEGRVLQLVAIEGARDVDVFGTDAHDVPPDSSTVQAPVSLVHASVQCHRWGPGCPFSSSFASTDARPQDKTFRVCWPHAAQNATTALMTLGTSRPSKCPRQSTTICTAVQPQSEGYVQSVGYLAKACLRCKGHPYRIGFHPQPYQLLEPTRVRTAQHNQS